MKTKKQFGWPVVALAALAGGALCAQVISSGSYAPSSAAGIRQAVPAAASTDSVYAVGPYATYAQALEPGDGQAEVQAYCSTCHTPNYITMQPPLPAATWATEVEKMKKTFGAQINAGAEQKIIRYLQTHYTPNTRKQ